jgi:KUP system potassium uptake protein
MRSYFNLRYLSVKEATNFGLDRSNVAIEKYPVVVSPVNAPTLVRE